MSCYPLCDIDRHPRPPAPMLPEPCEAGSPPEKYPVNLRPNFKIYCKEQNYCFRYFGSYYTGSKDFNRIYSDDDVITHYQTNNVIPSLCLLQFERWNLYTDMADLYERMTAAENNINALNTSSAEMSEAVTALRTDMDSLMTRVDALESNLTTLNADFQNHRVTDYNRWIRTEQMQTDINTLKAQKLNKQRDNTQTVDIETQAQSQSGYTVTNSLGGEVDCSAMNVLLSFGSLSVNGQEVWSSEGLTLSITTPIQHNQIVNDGDVITCRGMTNITFTPYISV